MGKRVTIKDIAEAAGVSIGTVHCALNGKPGVSEEKRQLINQVARNMDYRPNTLAASLKRKTIRIAAVVPGNFPTSRHYFSFIWKGIRDYLQSLDDYNIELLEFPCLLSGSSHSQTLKEVLEHHSIDGLLTTGYSDPKAIGGLLSGFAEKGIPVVLISNDMPQTGRLACVQPDYPQIGSTLAELICRQVGVDAPILMCAGHPAIPSHYLILRGFLEYMEGKGKQNPLHVLQSGEGENHFRELLEDTLRQEPDIAGCCSVNATDSVLLSEVLTQTGRAGKIIAVGSDLFRENLEALRQDVLTNLVNKKPYDQGYIAARYLTDHLIRETITDKDVIYVGSEIVFQSNLSNYDNDFYRFVTESPNVC